ncbi:hypothetical protein GLA29479_3631 [Lysobacter antibioticus]|uniref:hypothetical protein n=1 Tax=Lysobacter antibioticus TaxID=84531 RepID=UPI000717113E|nr:hypothetical protein [Lysobacter antibioticus]ALN64484.1 hypothetical protein GLA29479_3631 [Lysobacter antibioticus]
MSDIQNNPTAGAAELRDQIKTITDAAEQALASLHQVSGDAAGLVAQSAAAYFDGVSKIALASQGVLMKQTTQGLVEQSIEQSAEDALGLLATDLLMGAAAAVAAAAGAMEAESARFAIDRIDQSIARYSTMIRDRSP